MHKAEFGSLLHVAKKQDLYTSNPASSCEEQLFGSDDEALERLELSEEAPNSSVLSGTGDYRMA